MKGEVCAALGCVGKVTNVIKWREAGISVPVCADHIVAFSNSSMEVTSELVPEWRQPAKAQGVFDMMVKQAYAMFKAGKIDDARQAMRIASAHRRNCAEYDVGIDSSQYDLVAEEMTKEEPIDDGTGVL